MAPQRFFHTSHAELVVGDRLLPHAVTGESPWSGVYEHNTDESWRAGRVWLFATAQAAWTFGGGTNWVYEVEADGAVEHDWDPDWEDGLDYGMPSQFHAAEAIIVRVLPKVWGSA